MSETFLLNCFGVAVLTVLVYHALTTMDKEVKYFWSNPCSSTSLIYFSNRYIGVVGSTSTMLYYRDNQDSLSCRATLWASQICSLSAILFVDYILQIRVLALYYQNKKLSVYLKALFATEAALGLSLLIYITWYQDTSAVNFAQNATTCFSYEPPKALDIISWTVPLTFGMILLCLSLFKSAEYWKMSSRFKGFHLVRVLIQDQVLYFSFVIFCCTMQLLSIKFMDDSPFASVLLGVAGSPSLLSVLGSHLLVNLKEAGELGVNEGTNYRSGTISGIEFADGAPAPCSNDEEMFTI